MDILARNTCDHLVGSPPTSFLLATCPRCQGTGNYGGFVFDINGKITTLQLGPVLGQQIRKILIENRRPSGYGFDYSLFAGVIDPSKLSAIRTEVIRCLSYLRHVQQQEKAQGFTYNPQEELKSIVSVFVEQNSTEPRSVLVSAAVLSVSGTPASTVVTLRR